MGYGWEGEKIRLVPVDRQKHLENALRWFNDPNVTKWTLVGDWPIARLAEEQFFERAERENSEQAIFAIVTLSGEHIGFSDLRDIDLRHGTATTGSVIGQRELWGQGLGTDAARVRNRYAFEVLGLRLLLGDVIDGNVASVSMLKRAGYIEVGRIPKRYWKRGAFRDQILFANHSAQSEF